MLVLRKSHLIEEIKKDMNKINKKVVVPVVKKRYNFVNPYEDKKISEKEQVPVFKVKKRYNFVNPYEDKKISEKEQVPSESVKSYHIINPFESKYLLEAPE